VRKKNLDISNFFTGGRGVSEKEDFDDDLAINPVVQAKMILEKEDGGTKKKGKFKTNQPGALKRLRLNIGLDTGGKGDQKKKQRMLALQQLDRDLKKEQKVAVRVCGCRTRATPRSGRARSLRPRFTHTLRGHIHYTQTDGALLACARWHGPSRVIRCASCCVADLTCCRRATSDVRASRMWTRRSPQRELLPTNDVRASRVWTRSRAHWRRRKAPVTDAAAGAVQKHPHVGVRSMRVSIGGCRTLIVEGRRRGSLRRG
jgi:hypothetical protein